VVRVVEVMWKNMEKAECPLCGRLFAMSCISVHVDQCLNETDIVESASDISLSSENKRPRVGEEAEGTSPLCSSPALCDLTHSPLNTERTPVDVVPLTECASISRTPTKNMQSTRVFSKVNPSLAQNVKSARVCESAKQTLKRSTKATSVRDFFMSPCKSIEPNEIKPGRDTVKSIAGHLSTSHSDVQLLHMQSKSAGNVSDTLQSSERTVEERKRTIVAESHNSTVNQSAGAQSSATLMRVPLAERMRPTVLADFVGQGHIIGSQRPLRSLLESTSVSSMILWGPPGCGKVTVSTVITCLIFTHRVHPL